MAVRIRLKRMGNRNNPFYRIVVANGPNPLVGKAIEYIGTYDPQSAAGTAVLKRDRYDYWVGVGAIPTDTVKSLLKRAKDYKDTLPQAEDVPAETEESAEAAEPVASAE